MEHSVQLGTQYYRESICQRLRELRDQEALPMIIYEHQQGKRWLIDCEFQLPAQEYDGEQDTLKRIHSYYLANALAETILNQWEKDHVRWLLKRKYQLEKEEAEQVLTKALEYLNQRPSERKSYSINRKTTLVNQIITCLDTQPLFDIEGFLRFRAQAYKEEVKKAVSYVVDEHVLEKEYVEFIELLKHFVDSQNPRLDTLHVGITSEGNFHLYNEEGKKVTNQYIDDLSFGNEVNEFSYEDMLVSAIIAVAPRRIVLHIRYNGYKDTLQTIVKVFDGRVSYCNDGCFICEEI
ncbi:putative sporulation protein YtxC [Desulfitobacterium sp.]|uniref:putative sporulation protein YtxC n=1 Tax=Desulfitobacterium sp. TaxID=49981 RepID=UPI002C96786C|nr:putative sporulation protein YtxC [Desulfitobacterium sp.]HVJ49417.1 putative sporulation protein YtxC [Desulfitobacterium sp.]